MKKEALFLTHRIPYPPDKGDKIRSWRILEHLTRRFRVHLACFADDPRDMAHSDFLKSKCESVSIVPLSPTLARIRSAKGFLTGEPLSFQYFRDAQMVRLVNSSRERSLAAEIAFSSSMAPYIEQKISSRIRVVDFCDADSEKWRAYAENESGPMALIYRREADLLARAETRIANWADHSFAVSADEAAILNSREDKSLDVGWFSNGVDTEYFSPNARFGTPQSTDVLFVGAMDYRPNIQGVINFAETVWPVVREAFADARFTIVGSNPVPQVLALSGTNGIHVTGRVDDVRPWIAGTKVVIAPLKIARGIQNKVFEAMAMAAAIVATDESMTGINAPEGTAEIVQDLQQMSPLIAGLLDDHQRRRSMGAAARSYVEQSFQWANAMKRFDVAFKNVAD